MNKALCQYSFLISLGGTTFSIFSSFLFEIVVWIGGTYGDNASPLIATQIDLTAGSSRSTTNFFVFLSVILNNKLVTFPPNKYDAVVPIRLHSKK